MASYTYPMIFCLIDCLYVKFIHSFKITGMRYVLCNHRFNIAILALFISLAFNFQTFGARRLADCYHMSITMIDAMGIDPRTITLGENTADIEADILAAPYLNQNIVSTPVDKSSRCPGTELFCCATFVRLPDNTPSVPVRTINGISGKWHIQSVFFET